MSVALIVLVLAAVFEVSDGKLRMLFGIKVRSFIVNAVVKGMSLKITAKPQLR